MTMLLVVAACSSETTGPSDIKLVGSWSLSDNPQVWGVAAGSMLFRDDGTFMVSGSPFHELGAQGTWQRAGGMVTLTIDEDISTWQLESTREYVRFLEVAGMMRWFSIFKPGPD